MIVSHEWLKQFVPHSHTAQEIGELLSRHCVTLDGSADWYAYNPDPQRSQTEVCIKVPGASDPGVPDSTGPNPAQPEPTYASPGEAGGT